MHKNILFRLLVFVALIVVSLDLLNYQAAQAQTASLAVDIKNNGTDNNQQSAFSFRVRNMGSSAASGISVRIYYTLDGANAGTNYALEKYWDQSGVATVSAPTQSAGSTWYFTVNYGSASLAAGASWEFQTGLHLVNWGADFNSGNDWWHSSYAVGALPAAFAATANIPAYVNGTHVSGSEPGGSTVPTNTPVSATATRASTTVPTATRVSTQVPTQSTGSQVFQAEQAVLGGGSFVESSNSGFIGSGYVNSPTSGGSIQFNGVSGTGGSVTLTFRYALGVTSSRSGLLIVNGASQSITFQPTGSWTTWTNHIVNVTLNSGTGNTIRLESNGQDLANIDQLTVGAPSNNPTATPISATATRTPTRTSATATRTPTRTNTSVGPTNTPTRTPTQGTINPGNQVGYSTQNGGTTGGAGGVTVNASTGTQIHQAICGRASRTTPIIIRVSGTINHGNTTQVSGNCSTAADKIEIKDVSNISIIGVGTTAIFDQLGIHIRNASNIIIQNVHVRNVKKSGSPISNGGDAIGMETNVRNVWVDHVTLEASGGESEGYDGLFDLKDNTQYVTLSWSILKNSERGGLVGSGDSDSANNFITYHHNHFQNLNSRVPLLRFATAHAFNNYYNGIVESGMNPRIGGRIKAENNYFTNALNPLGTFYTDDMGFWDVSGNIWGPGVTWSAPGSDMHPAGPNVVSTTSISIPYSYSLDPAANVPSIVTSGAGVGKIN